MAGERYVAPPKVSRKPAAETGTECGEVSEYGSRRYFVLDGRVNSDLCEGKLGSGLSVFKIRCGAC